MTPSKQKSDNRTRCVRVRLSPEEYASIMKKAEKFTGGNLSVYTRKLLLNKKIPVEIYDTTVGKFSETIGEFTKHIKKIGVNHNQIARFIQAKYPPQEANLLLGKEKELFSEILKYTAEIYKITKKIQRHYDSKDQ